MNTLARFFPPLLLALNGLIYCVIGGLFIWDPVSWFATAGIELRSAIGYTELRSVYGGFMLGFGLFQLICAWNRHYLAPGLLLFVLTYAGLVAARSWGVLIEEAYNPVILQIYIAEWCSLVLGVIAWFMLKRP